MMGKRKRYSAEFKAKVAMEPLRGELTISQCHHPPILVDTGYGLRGRGEVLFAGRRGVAGR